MSKIDFSSGPSPTTFNMDFADGGEVNSQFKPFTNQIMKSFINDLVVPLLPEEFFTQGGISLEDNINRISSHSDFASSKESQFFEGLWQSDDKKTSLELRTNNDQVSGWISNSKDRYKIDHISLQDQKLKFTFLTAGKMLIEIRGAFEGNKLTIETLGIEDNYGIDALLKQDSPVF